MIATLPWRAVFYLLHISDMMNNKWIFWSALALGVALVLAVWIGSNSILSVKQPRKVVVTGLAEQDFDSDLVVWSASYRVKGSSVTEAYREIEPMRVLVQQYLDKHSLPKETYSFGSVDIEQSFSSGYDAHGNYQSVPNGYVLMQAVTVTSSNIDQVEEISKNISELITQGVEVTSGAPKYYYTKLGDLKHKMLQTASADALARAREIAEGSDARVGKLREASMGVFQIVGKNSDEDYSWGGSFNTSSRKKTASITVKATYALR